MSRCARPFCENACPYLGRLLMLGRRTRQRTEVAMAARAGSNALVYFGDVVADEDGKIVILRSRPSSDRGHDCICGPCRRQLSGLCQQFTQCRKSEETPLGIGSFQNPVCVHYDAITRFELVDGSRVRRKVEGGEHQTILLNLCHASISYQQ